MSNVMNFEEMKILSVEECDEDYGQSLVQYRLGDDHVSFAFCNVDVSSGNYDIDEIKKEISGKIKDDFKKPLWSDLSEDLRNEILESQFDMHFIEFDDENWSKEKADKVWDEAVKFSLACGSITRDDDCYLAFFAGAMGDVNWSGHPYYGEPCLEEIIVSPERLEEIKSQNGVYTYIDQFGGTNYVQFEMNMYADNDNLYLGLIGYDPEFDAFSPYGDVTVNIITLDYLEATLDTNNNGPQLIPFLIENGFGELTGRSVRSGFCEFPIFKFSQQKLEELFPEEFPDYKKAHGRSASLETIIDGAKKETGKINDRKDILEKEPER